jgi:NAD(P)H-dependent FMN reductase
MVPTKSHRNSRPREQTDHSLKILVVQGTVRDGRKSIHPARYVTKQLQKKGHTTELFDMKDYEIPLLTKPRHMTSDPHPDVDAFGQKVEEADSIVIVTPEYNHSIPGTLKNLLDHLYPEYEDTPFAYITVSAGGFGGVRTLSHLHDITLELNAHPGPDLPVSNVTHVFDEDSTLIDDTYEDKFEEFVEQAVEHAEQFAQSDVRTNPEVVV